MLMGMSPCPLPPSFVDWWSCISDVHEASLQDTERNIGVCHTQTRSSAACCLKVIAIFHIVSNLISCISIQHSG